MKRFTLETLAKMAGVGIATVDRVLNERGGVSPQTTRKVLQAARAVGLKRVLPQEYQHPWQIEVLLSSNDAWFFKKLAQDFIDVANGLGYRRITLHRTFMSESHPQKLAQHIIECSEKRDGIIVFAHDDPALYDALAVCKARNVPVITIVTDLPGAERLCHVGINQQQAGRTAGLLMKKAASQPGEVLTISGRFDYRAHWERVAGFREVLQQRAPWLILREVLAGQDQRDTIRRLLEENLARCSNLVGIYNTGVGNAAISEALARHRLAGKCLYITHELYSTTRRLLEEDAVSFTLDQNAQQHAQLATQIMLNYLETGHQPEAYQDGKVELKIITAENLC
ncbi:LacI family DNA-binding transcriptional regulator [Mixta sp. Marseille-Q2659]|uniref:LacI family DNA-binding transcriptional regulator n=1 Tax=Mixta sp. Marseille-Q2659 TaxID=2736607 RepID=UPI0023B8F65B|nr:LacI family DNA-binding transcriptional regulator [Mixta sp. Marseille-Q2659]